MKKKTFIFTRFKKIVFSAGTRPEWLRFDGRWAAWWRNLSEKKKVHVAWKLSRCPLPTHTHTQVAVSICLRLDGCKIRRGDEEEAWLQSHPSRQSQSASGELFCLRYGCCCKGPLEGWGVGEGQKKNDSRQATYSTYSSFCLQSRS